MRLCEAACAPVCVSLNGGKHHHTQMPAKPNEAGSAERGGAAERAIFGHFGPKGATRSS